LYNVALTIGNALERDFNGVIIPKVISAVESLDTLEDPNILKLSNVNDAVESV